MLKEYTALSKFGIDEINEGDTIQFNERIKMITSFNPLDTYNYQISNYNSTTTTINTANSNYASMGRMQINSNLSASTATINSPKRITRISLYNKQIYTYFKKYLKKQAKYVGRNIFIETPYQPYMYHTTDKLDYRVNDCIEVKFGGNFKVHKTYRNKTMLFKILEQKDNIFAAVPALLDLNMNVQLLIPAYTEKDILYITSTDDVYNHINTCIKKTKYRGWRDKKIDITKI